MLFHLDVQESQGKSRNIDVKPTSSYRSGLTQMLDEFSTVSCLDSLVHRLCTLLSYMTPCADLLAICCQHISLHIAKTLKWLFAPVGASVPHWDQFEFPAKGHVLVFKFT